MSEDLENEKHAENSCLRQVALTSLRILGVLGALYAFLFGLDLMGVAFKALGGKGAGMLFSITDNPIAGLMVGILATVLVQSSSTSTSIVVGLVGAGQLSVHNAIPIVMGANIGTSVTNTIVSMAHMGERLELERAFSGATVHDMFNMLSVITLLPLEVVIGAIQGDGGPIYWVSMALTDAIVGTSKKDISFSSPTKAIVSPLVEYFLHPDKNVIKALSLEPVPVACEQCTGREYCISGSLLKKWEHINEAAVEELQYCAPSITACGSRNCILDADQFFKEQVEHGEIIQAGFLKGLGDLGGGILALILSLLVICMSLFCMVKLLHSLILGRAKAMILRATNMNDYLAMAVGCILTFIVQSSSVVTSALTPLCGIGVLPVHKMFPMTLGANIGTTFTALLAALAVLKHDSLQIAFCHLLFNIFGIIVWFPVPPMRRVVVSAAKLLGFYASYWRFVPLAYILVMFLAVPGLCLAISILYGASLAAGIVCTVLALLALTAIIAWWNTGGCYRVVSKEARQQREIEVAERAAAEKEEPIEAVQEIEGVQGSV